MSEYTRRDRSARLLGGLLLFLGALVLGGAAGPAQAQGTPPKPSSAALPGCGVVVPAGWLGYPGEQFFAVSALGAEDAWAVGTLKDLGYRIVAQHWDGQQWTYRTPPDVGNSGVLTGVAMAGHDDVWAVGTSRRTEHWDGKGWTLVPNPSPESLAAIVARTSADVWAAGGTTIIHWDGFSWSLVPHPLVTGPLVALAVRASDDVWAVGGPDILHWDGLAWTLVPNPPGGSLVSVAAPAAADAWAVGSGNGGTEPMIEHWDGTTWSLAPLPALASTDNQLTGIAAGAANDVWAVGSGYGDSDYQTLVLHWEGLAWSVVPSGNAALDDNRLFAVSAPALGVMWAVGKYARWDHGYETALTVQYTPACPPPPPPACDGTFHILPSPNVANDAGVLYGVAAPAPNDAWAVGASHPGGTALLIHWDGQHWQRVAPPNNQALTAISARTADDIWAVGDQIIHWDGVSWGPVPPPLGLTGPLHGVAAFAADDVWAVGTQIIHWNGTAWSVYPNPTRQPLNAVTARAANDAWAVGGSKILHWDGIAWTQVPGPADVRYNSIAAFSSSEVWAVGSTASSRTPRQRIVHWDGTAWTVDPQVNDYGALYAVSVPRSGDVWVDGSINYIGTSDAYPLIMHGDGHGWSVVDAPRPISIPGSIFYGLTTGVGTGDLWAVGTSALADSLTERLQSACSAPPPASAP